MGLVLAPHPVTSKWQSLADNVRLLSSRRVGVSLWTGDFCFFNTVLIDNYQCN